MTSDLTEQDLASLRALLKSRIKYWQRRLNDSNEPRDSTFDSIIQLTTDSDHKKHCDALRIKASERLNTWLPILIKLENL